MVNQEVMNIYDVLDYINERFGYEGINNEGKITTNRDDLITKNAFHNWIRRYNNKIDIKNRRIQSRNERVEKDGVKPKALEKSIEPIKKSKQNKDTVYRKKDVDTLIEVHEGSLKKAYLEKTEEVWVGWKQNKRMRIPSSIVKQREANDGYIDYMEKQQAIELKDQAIKLIINKFIDEEKLLNDCELHLKEKIESLNLEDYIRTELLK